MKGEISKEIVGSDVAVVVVVALQTEHRNAQGRVYWYHQGEKKSVWEKPIELKTAREVSLYISRDKIRRLLLTFLSSSSESN